jgi:hypothetical protein
MQAERQRRWYANLTPEQRETRRIRQRMENLTPQQAAQRRERDDKYEQSRIKVNAGGLRWSYRVPPEKKDKLVVRLRDFRAEQRLS